MTDHADTINAECEQLKADIMRLGKRGHEGVFTVPFGVLFDDEAAQQYYEALVGTLKAARKKGIIDIKGQVHGFVPVFC